MRKILHPFSIIAVATLMGGMFAFAQQPPAPTPAIGNPGAAQAVQGNVASGTTDVGSPVKVGGVFNTTQPTVTNGQRVDAQSTARGEQKVAISSGAISVAITGPGDGVSNSLAGLVTTTFPELFSGGSAWSRSRDITGAQISGAGTQAVAIAPTSAVVAGQTGVVSAAAEATHVLKATAGNFYSAYAVNFTATAGFLIVTNSATAPADGPVTPLECVPLPANGVAQINYGSGPPSVFSTGISVSLSSGANCFTKTTGVITGFIKGGVS